MYEYDRGLVFVSFRRRVATFTPAAVTARLAVTDL
jgi:hypothetical protein